MDEKYINCKHILLAGTDYEVGYQLGTLLKLKDNQALIRHLTQPFMGGPKLTKDAWNTAVLQLDRYCNGINEEIKGFADAVGADWKEIVYYYTYLQMNQGNCSQIAITPEKSTDHHAYLARNYEFGWEEEPILIETRIEGQYRQIGFGCQLFGRFDGMNEKGLCVTTSAGVVNPPYHERGFVFPVVVRAILNQCQSVKEALAVFKEFPFADYRNIVILDQEGNAARIEAAAGNCHITEAESKEDCNCLYATNHYESKELKAQYRPLQHSMTRYQAIKKLIEPKEQKISKEQLRTLLSDKMPEGLCCHYYKDGMGTMWSILFDATKIRAEICFGAPDAVEVNRWRAFSLDSDGEEKAPYLREYKAVLSNESSPDDFWKYVE